MAFEIGANEKHWFGGLAAAEAQAPAGKQRRAALGVVQAPLVSFEESVGSILGHPPIRKETVRSALRSKRVFKSHRALGVGSTENQWVKLAFVALDSCSALPG